MNGTKRSWVVTLAVFFTAVFGLAPVANALPVPIGNSSFEAPELNGDFAYQPAGATWSFAGNGGISAPPSGFGSTPAPDGDQYAFLQTISSFSQQITVPVDGTYVLTFFAAGRPPGATFGGTQTYQALLDAEIIFPASTTDNGGPFTAEQSAPFFATAGTHTLMFQGLNGSADQTAFIDAIAINGAAVARVPEPSAILLLTVARFGRPRLAMAALATAVLVGSFVSCVAITDFAGAWAYFSLPTRAWQLAAGGLLALGAPALGRVPLVVAAGVGWIGAALLGASPHILGIARRPESREA